MPTAVNPSHRHTSKLLPRRHYPKPPIVEAVIDIQVDPSPSCTVDALTRIREGAETRFAQANEFHASTVTFDVATGQQQHVESQLEGYQFVGADRADALLARRSGFTYSKLPPYTRWESVSDTAREWWERYCAVAKPLSATRIAVRYINRIDVPLEGPPLRAYFLAFPELGPLLQRPVSEFTMRVVMPQIDMPGVTLALSQGRVLNPLPDRLSVILDLDLFASVRLAPESEEIWSALQLMHDRENEVFESCVTDLARGLFGYGA